jgi:transglutaminase superfamily protein/coenzyme PQQ synthesis protein D (PqqD)
MRADRCARFHASTYVLTARAADATVLLDRRRGRYFTLNQVGGRVWELAAGGATVAETIERILVEYEVPRWEVEHDVAATLERLIDDRLLTPGVASDPNPAERARPLLRAPRNPGRLELPSVLGCGLLIAWFKALLRVRGFLPTLEWIRRKVEPVPAAVDAEIETVRSVEYRVALAGALYPGRAKCLEQSLTLYYLLRRQGVAVVYCQGAQPHPFLAHAWVEYRKLPVNDFPEHIKQFAAFPEFAP